MRIRLLLCGLAVVVLGVLGPSVAAHAQEEEHDFADEAAEECYHLLAEGKSVDDCQEAPSPILPATNELIWGALSFAILFALLAKYGWPALRKGLEDRTERIKGDIEAAETARTDAEAVIHEYQAKLAEARQEAARVIEEARQDADQYRQSKRAEIDADIARLREDAQASIEASKAQALADIRGEVASLAIEAAEHVVGQSLDRDANVALVEQFIDSVGAKGAN